MKDFLNCKVRCIKGIDRFTTKDKIYDIKNGCIEWDNGRRSISYNSLYNMNYSCASKFELYQEDEFLSIHQLEIGKEYEFHYDDNEDSSSVFKFKIDKNRNIYNTHRSDTNSNFVESIIDYNTVINGKFKEIPQTHTITIDGKDLQLSHESALSLKEWLNKNI